MPDEKLDWVLALLRVYHAFGLEGLKFRHIVDNHLHVNNLREHAGV